MVREARGRTPPRGCFNTLENRFNTSGSVPQPPCKDAVSKKCNLRPSSPLQSSLIFLPITTSMSLLVGLLVMGSPKKLFTPAISVGSLVRRKTEFPMFAFPSSPFTGLYSWGLSQGKRVATSSNTLAMPSPAERGPLRCSVLEIFLPPSSASSPSPGKAALAEATAWSILSVNSVSRDSQFFRDRSYHCPVVHGGMEK